MSTFDGSSFVTTLWASAVGIVLLMALTFAVAKRVGHHSVIDVTWGLGFGVVAVVSAVVGGGDSTRRYVVMALTLVWGLRLASHIGRRQVKVRGEDPRYAKMLSRVKGNKDLFALRQIYGLQAVIMFVVSLVLQLDANMRGGLNALAYVGVAVWALGLFFEAVGDRQLQAFRDDPANKGQVMDRGLWAYTRHPNYFGDATVWVGLFLITTSTTPIGLAALPSTAIMVWFLAYGSGKPILERQMMRTKPGYAQYAQRVSGFVPLPPKKKAAQPA